MQKAFRILLVGFIAFVLLILFGDTLLLFAWAFLTGWLRAGLRLWSTLRFDPAYVVLILVALAAICYGSHHFCRWFSGKCSIPSAKSWRWRWTLAVQAAFWLTVLAGFSLIALTHQTGWILTSDDPWFQRRGHIRERVELQTIAMQMEAIARSNNWAAAQLKTAYWQGHRDGSEKLRELFENHDFVIFETNRTVAAFAVVPRRPGRWAIICDPTGGRRLLPRAEARGLLTQISDTGGANQGSAQ